MASMLVENVAIATRNAENVTRLLRPLSNSHLRLIGQRLFKSPKILRELICPKGR